MQITTAGGKATVRAEFDRQVANLIEKEYHAAAGLSEPDFLALIEPLRGVIDELSQSWGGPDHVSIPFVVVIKSDVVATEHAMARVTMRRKPGLLDTTPVDVARFAPIDGVTVPSGAAYLLLDIDTGTESLNVTPDNALPTIQRAGRSPLTIDEGVALVTHFPEILRTRNCFSMLGSRCGDRRVPALWVTRQGRPRLGWCWAGNPHTWLGSASCGGRAGAA